MIFFNRKDQEIQILMKRHCVLAFPPGCEFYTGPFALPCLISLWEEAGCVKEGRKHPSKLGQTAESEINELNLK